MRRLKITLIILLTTFLFLSPQTVDAQVLFELPECAQTTGDCQLPDAVNTLIAVAEFIFGITGSLVLLMFVYGGFLWITSGGSEQRITKGKDTVRQAIIGLIIVFLSGALIQFALKALDVDEQFNLLEGRPAETIKQ